MNRPLKLLTIKRILLSVQYCTHYRIYEIWFENNHSLAATRSHAFTTVRNGEIVWLPTDKLVSGDQIWVDVYAFEKDKSYRKLRRFTKGN